MKFNKCVFYILLFFTSISYSQTTTEKSTLTSILIAIEEKFDVKFSYSVDDVKHVFIENPSKEYTLNQTIAYLNAKTLLNFKVLDARYITVSVVNKTIDICGIILAQENNEPLLGATIIITNTQTGTATNYSGKFKLTEVPSHAIIRISYLGYETQQLKANHFFNEENNCKTIVLKEMNEALNQITITKFLTTGLQKRLDGSTVLNTEKFGILPGLIEPDILESIQALPGVESANESIANINVRGGTNDQNLIIWDDIKMYHSGHFFGLISAYNPNLTNKVIVTKNGTSSEFSDGVSSTINMGTKDDLTNTLSGGAGFNLISADAFLQIPISKKLELHLSGRRSFTDYLSTPTYDNYFERSFQDSDISTQTANETSTSSDFFFYDYSAKLLFDVNEKHKFRANIIGIHNNLDYEETITNTEEETISKNSNLSQENLGFGGNWQAQWSKRFKTKLIGYSSKYTVNADDYSVQTDQRLQQGNEVLETGLKLNSYFAVNGNFSLLNGYQFNETGILNNTFVSAPSYLKEKKDVLLNHAFFSEAEYKKNNTYLRVGVRFNYFQKFGKLLIEPRINFRQKLTKNVALKVEGEFKNQSTTQIIDFQDDFLGVENRRWILANEENIPISTSKQASFGFEFKKNNFHLDLTSFYKKVNGITASNQGFYNNFQYLNATGNYTAKGIEFLTNLTKTNYSTWFSYTFSKNNYTFHDFAPSTFPNNADIRHSVSLAFNYSILENLEISLGGIYRSGLPYTKPFEGNETSQSGSFYFVNYDVPNNENLDAFKRLDASLSYSFNLSQGLETSLRIGVKNITNQNNVIHRYYIVDPDNTDQTIKVDNHSLGFTPNASLRVQF
ncbi:MAG: carboxypeptidase-like regulatory domain-containing protein [Oceanihabitans sp.]|nr:carboxypeptidase-like regulatory domain-containing protein [Oceanihabitans sp.]